MQENVMVNKNQMDLYGALIIMVIYMKEISFQRNEVQKYVVFVLLGWEARIRYMLDGIKIV